MSESSEDALFRFLNACLGKDPSSFWLRRLSGGTIGDSIIYITASIFCVGASGLGSHVYYEGKMDKKDCKAILSPRFQLYHQTSTIAKEPYRVLKGCLEEACKLGKLNSVTDEGFQVGLPAIPPE